MKLCHSVINKGSDLKLVAFIYLLDSHYLAKVRTYPIVFTQQSNSPQSPQKNTKKAGFVLEDEACSRSATSANAA